jgi:hypothetical protein
MRNSPEASLIASFRQFVLEMHLVSEADCHFGGDDEDHADVELHLNPAAWPQGTPQRILLEAKSHHSTDAPNTINKVFGQLLKETGKSIRASWTQPSFCSGILIPIDGIDRNEGSKRLRRGSGIEYYRRGFQRIPRLIFEQFGVLVNARYVFAYSEMQRALSVYSWSGFHVSDAPFIRFES